VLQFVAVCCNVLQCVSPSDITVLQCVVVCCSVFQCVAVCCRVFQCVAVWCSAVQCVALCCSVAVRLYVYEYIHIYLYIYEYIHEIESVGETQSRIPSLSEYIYACLKRCFHAYRNKPFFGGTRQYAKRSHERNNVEHIELPAKLLDYFLRRN